jgi:uncharacterized membrane protein HdeD (DUF308 family)
MENSISCFWGKSHHWRWLFALGVLTILGGGWFFVQPMAAYELMAVFFGLSMFLGGFILLMSAYVNRHEKPSGWLGLVLSGVFSLFFGAFLTLNLGYTEAALPYIFAFTLLFQGVFNLLSSVRMYKWFKMWWVYLFSSVLFLLLSVIFLFYPFSSIAALVFVSAIMMIYWGVHLLFVSLDLRPRRGVLHTPD